MKRTKSLVASILGLIIDALMVVSNVYFGYIMIVVFALASIGDGNGEVVALIMMAGLVLLELILLTNFVLKCISFSLVKAPQERYEKRKGLFVSIVVFNFIVAAVQLLLSISVNLSVVYRVLGVVVAVILIVCNILYLVDMNTKKPAEIENETVSAQQDQQDIQ